MRNLIDASVLSSYGSSAENHIVENMASIIVDKKLTELKDWSIEIANFKGRDQLKMSCNKLDVYVKVYSSGAELLNIICVSKGNIIASKSHPLVVCMVGSDLVERVIERMNRIATSFNAIMECSDMYQ